MPPRIDHFTFGESPIYAGESAQITCFVAQGDLPLNITWSFENSDDLSRVHASTSKAGKKGVVLFIESVSTANIGEYKCTASNLAGVASYSASLEVHGNEL